MFRYITLCLALLLAPAVVFAQAGGNPTNAVGLWGQDAATGLPCIVAPAGGSTTCGVPQASTAAGGITPVTAAAASGLVLKASAGSVYSVNVIAPATAGFACVLDASSIPADGVVTWRWAFPLAANAGLDKVFPVPLTVTAGAVLVFSSSACPSITKVAAITLAGQAK